MIFGNEGYSSGEYVTRDEFYNELEKLRLVGDNQYVSVDETAQGQEISVLVSLGGEEPPKEREIVWELIPLFFEIQETITPYQLRINGVPGTDSWVIQPTMLTKTGDENTISYPDMNRAVGSSNGYVVGKFYYDESAEEWNNNAVSPPVFVLEMTSSYPQEYTWNSSASRWELRYPLAYVSWGAGGSTPTIKQINIGPIRLLGS